MSMARAFKRIFAVASGATAVGITFIYTDQLYRINSQIQEPDAILVDKINKAYEEFQKAENCDPLLKKHLTPALLTNLEYKMTKLGGSMFDLIRSGMDNKDSEIGICAADVESYKKFAPLFDAIIKDYHGFEPDDKQPPIDLGEQNFNEFAPLDPSGKYIKSLKITCFRSVKGYPFNSLLTSDDYLIVEQKVKNALSSINDTELKGIYNSLTSMPKRVKEELSMSHLLVDDHSMEVFKTKHYWPTGRGIYFNRDKTFVVMVNSDDHVKIISRQEGSDVGKALERLVRGIKIIESQISFAYDSRLGWLTSSPKNLGSAVHASVQIRLPKITSKKDFLEICEKLNLQASRMHGDNSIDGSGGYYLISNKRSLGLTQYQAVKELYDGIKELIRMENQS